MRTVMIGLFASMMLFTLPAFAGPGHSHEHGHGHSHGPIGEKEAINKASEKLKQFVQHGKLPKSWSAVTATGAEKKTFSKGPEWVITFHNAKVENKDKQNIYFFYTLDGHYIAANYTGE